MYRAARCVLEGRGHTVSVTSVAPRAATSEDGVSVPVSVRIGDIKTYEYDAFVFVGAEGARAYFDGERVRKLPKDVKFKTVGATGNAPVILALSEVLKDQKATCHAQFAGLLIQEGAVFTNRPLEVDGKIATVKDASNAEQFANTIAQAVE